jgi:hypothetical protein
MCEYKPIDELDRELIVTRVNQLCTKLKINTESEYKLYIKNMTQRMMNESSLHTLTLVDLKFTLGSTAERFVEAHRLLFSPESININILANGRHLFYYLKYIYFILTTQQQEFNFRTTVNIVLFCHRSSFELYQKQLDLGVNLNQARAYNWQNHKNKFEYNFADYLNTTEFLSLARELSYFARFSNLHIHFFQSPNELMIGIGAKRAVINCLHYMLQDGQASAEAYRCMTIDDNISGIYQNVSPTCTKRFATTSSKRNNYFEDMISLLFQLKNDNMAEIYNYYYYPIDSAKELRELLDNVTPSDIFMVFEALRNCIIIDGESIHSVEYILARLEKFKNEANADQFAYILELIKKKNNCYGIIRKYATLESSGRSRVKICPKTLLVIKSSLYLNVLNFIVKKRHCDGITILDLYGVCSADEYKEALMLGVDKGGAKGNENVFGNYHATKSISLYKLFYNNPWYLFRNNYLYNPYFTRFYEDILFNIAIPKNSSCKLGYYLRFAHIADEDNDDKFKKDLYISPAMPVIHPYYLWIFIHLKFFPFPVTTEYDTSKKIDILTCNNFASFMQPYGLGKYAKFAVLLHSYYNNYNRQREFDIFRKIKKKHAELKPNYKEGYVPHNLAAYLKLEYKKIIPDTVQQIFENLTLQNITLISTREEFNDCLDVIQKEQYRTVDL